jgi:hypothetical protein
LPIKQNKKDSKSKTGRGKKVQLEEEKENEAEDTTLHITCGRSFSQDGTEEKLTLQLGFFSVIRCHDPCKIDLLNHAVTKLRNI